MFRRFLPFALLLVLVLSVSLAQADASWADTDVYTPISVSLLMRMATREGPSTDYVEPGSFFQEGATVQVISLSYDVNSVPWVQVEFAYRGVMRRAYTGLKRVDISAARLPVDATGVPARVTATANAYAGPGTWYAQYDFTVPYGTEGVMYNREGGYAQFTYRDDAQRLRLVWIDTAYLSSSQYVPTKVTITAAPVTAAPSVTSGNAHVLWSCQPYAGPGNTYAQFDYLVYSGTRGILYSIENGYAQFSYDPGDDSARRIVWLPADFVELD